MTVSIYIADDHGLVREGLSVVIGREENFQVVGQGSSGREAVAAVESLHPQVVIMDVAMGDMNGIEATRQIIKAQPKTKIIAVSSYGAHRYVLGMIRAGAAGYVLKSEAFVQLRLAIHEVMKGNSYLSPLVSATVVGALREDGATGDSDQTTLSSRERQIIQLVAEGFSSPDIGDKLNISVATVDTHRRNIMRKLDLHNVAALTRFAIREGLTSVDE
jgi:DNA-binding NarL/FixJ family response regulator